MGQVFREFSVYSRFDFLNSYIFQMEGEILIQIELRTSRHSLTDTISSTAFLTARSQAHQGGNTDSISPPITHELNPVHPENDGFPESYRLPAVNRESI